MKAFQRGNFKILKAFCGTLFVVCFAGSIILYYHQSASNTENVREGVSIYRQARLRHEIQGFRFDSNSDGKRVILIKADRFGIQNKKVGFFRFGLMNEAILENAVVDLYGWCKQSEDNKSDNWRDSIFNDVFSKETFLFFSVKRISSVLMEPVCVNFHREDLVVTEISASRAVVRLRKRDILFKGAVKVVSGSRVLTTDYLRMLLDKAVIKIDRQFIMKAPGQQWEGRHLTTDIFLNLERLRCPEQFIYSSCGGCSDFGGAK